MRLILLPAASRLALALLAVAASGCGPSFDHLSDADIDAATKQAVEAADWGRAFALQKEAAYRGDVGALSALVTAHERGHIRIPAGPDQPQEYRKVWSLPGQAAQLRRRYERALADGVRAGDPEALLIVAHALVADHRIIDGEIVPMHEANRDSVRAIYRQIVDADVPHMTLALLAKRLGDDDAYRQHVGEAVAAGEPQACTFQIWFTGTKRDLSTPEGYAGYLDALAGCDDADAQAHAADGLRPLAENVAAGMPEAVAFYDGLRAEGVFERHPHLAPLFDA